MTRDSRFLDEYATAIAEQFSTEASKRQSGNTEGPADLGEQLLFALETYSEKPDAVMTTLHPHVRRNLTRIAPDIDEAQAGTSEDCDALCVKLAKRVNALRGS